MRAARGARHGAGATGAGGTLAAHATGRWAGGASVAPACCWACLRKLQVTSYKLQVTSYKLQVTSYKLQATSYKLQATNYKLQVTNNKLQVTSYKLQATSHKLQAASCKLQATSHTQVQLVLCWSEMRVRCAVDGEPLLATFAFPKRLHADFGPHRLLARRSKLQVTSFKLQASSLQVTSYKLPHTNSSAEG